MLFHLRLCHAISFAFKLPKLRLASGNFPTFFDPCGVDAAPSDEFCTEPACSSAPPKEGAWPCGCCVRFSSTPLEPRSSGPRNSEGRALCRSCTPSNGIIEDHWVACVFNNLTAIIFLSRLVYLREQRTGSMTLAVLSRPHFTRVIHRRSIAVRLERRRRNRPCHLFGLRLNAFNRSFGSDPAHQKDPHVGQHGF